MRYFSPKEQNKFPVTKLVALPDGNTSFEETIINTHQIKPISKYYTPSKVKGLYFRNSIAGEVYDFHTSPRKQYIIYLSGAAVIETSQGAKKTL